MKKLSLAVAVVAVAMVLVVSGCTTVPKQYREEMTGMKTKVDTLESRVETVESKQAEVEKASVEQAQSLEQLKAQKQQQFSRSNVGILVREGSPHGRTRDVQTALKNAGFYDGKIDGVKGNQTNSAIKAFQKANGLRADGVVGPRTWDLLCTYLSGAEASAPAAASEPAAGGESESIK